MCVRLGMFFPISLRFSISIRALSSSPLYPHRLSLRIFFNYLQIFIKAFSLSLFSSMHSASKCLKCSKVLAHPLLIEVYPIFRDFKLGHLTRDLRSSLLKWALPYRLRYCRFFIWWKEENIEFPRSYSWWLWSRIKHSRLVMVGKKAPDILGHSFIERFLSLLSLWKPSIAFLSVILTQYSK